MIDASDKIEKIHDEIEDYYADDDIYNFNSWGADLSFRELIERYDNNELIKPELQRKYVWDKTEASRFIDSILLKLPVPSIFLAKQPNETLLIIDGYQRLMTVYDYVKGIFSQDKKVFKLSNSNKINDRWRGKAFKELTDTEQRRIRNTTIHAIIFVQTRPSNDDTGMYQVFERINTSGRTLFPQEIRNCIYQGSINKLLFELNENEMWRKLFGTKEPDSRMRDMEFILRFLTFNKLNFRQISTKAISLKKELNLFMGNSENAKPTEIKKFRKVFNNTIEHVFECFGDSAFHNISQTKKGELVPKFNPTVYDSIILAFVDKNIDTSKKWEENRRKLLNNEEYQNAIRIRTTDIDNIKKRIQLAEKYLFGAK